MRFDLAVVAYGLKPRPKLSTPHSQGALHQLIVDHGRQGLIDLLSRRSTRCLDDGTSVVRINRYVRLVGNSVRQVLDVYGNCIYQQSFGRVRIRDCGWPTKTTCAWLQALHIPVVHRGSGLVNRQSIELYVPECQEYVLVPSLAWLVGADGPTITDWTFEGSDR